MFGAITESFQSAINKIRFQDDEKALKRALDELKKTLLKSDVHYKVLKSLLEEIEQKTKLAGIGKENFLNALKESLTHILTAPGNYGFIFAPKPPTIVLMAGLQGSGKTTTTAKLANYLKNKQKKVLLAACDLQRLAAVEQLRQLSLQVEVDFFYEENKSPIEIAIAAKEKAISGLYDVLIVDSAGRLAIDEDLMQELQGIKDSIQPNEIFYVVDSLSGQDGVKSAAIFHEKMDLSGVILSKFDGDSKGGIALSIAHQLGIPLRFIGVGEKIPDLEVFIPQRIVGRLMGAGDIHSLAEKTAAIISEKEAKDISKKIKKGKFTFNDFLAQMDNIKKIGSMQSIISMLPGLGNMAGALKDVDLDNSKEIKQIRAMVNSMTPKERENPDLLNGSRKKRIALGAGVDVSDVNRFLKQFENAAKMAKRFSSKGGMSDLMALMKDARMGGLKR
ncbi:signal recognition particle protein [Helicobacter pullorum]|uniref:Signal recognition particle protein n=2 Tax=Helicobacter pullorum TaxID=35818 RepID=A0A0N1E6X2_9HELI|nr:signal recognition particle protein [Helicobacter pullorum]HIS08945.1 signal recognition particle protein [Candidatus Scatomorpha intestinipullorum]EEQ64427.1 signal recognition particle protein [Helicobacter pullorum MIT 98-5489]KAB0574585.1 signal recognition particle protein [Helicobacter pullorum NCTC 12824]KPH49751.1 signal recognition particle [Helicobacter pullorum]KPH50945.1 signal recognition particle [Helicobacter pullorum]